MRAVPFQTPPVIVPPETVKPLTAVALREPPEIVAPLMVELHAKTPVEFVTVQPVEPEPPPRRMSPVEVPPIKTWPEPDALRVMFWLVPPAVMLRAL